MGLITSTPFLVVKRFPDDLMAAFDAATGRPHLGNVVASGTDVIDRYGEEHLRTGAPIIYTSADSVFQIAAHTGVVPLETLYAWSATARELLTGEHLIARVIARPFTGQPGAFRRQGEHRKDLAVPPTSPTILNALHAAERDVVAIGKINDIFSGRGVTTTHPTTDDMHGVDTTIAALRERPNGLIFTNLVGFDALYGHRRDPIGYSNLLAAFDARLPELRAALADDAILILTSDHGTDPTHEGTDHTREHALLLVTGTGVIPRAIPTRDTFADLGATIAELLGVAWDGDGASFARELVTPPR